MRLIDADALREDILNDTTNDSDVVNYYLDMVDGMETAYDMDKVMEQLDNLFPLQTTAGEFVSENDVTNLVEGGGVDE